MARDAVQILQEKAIMLKLVPLVFTLILFFYMIPIAQLDTLREKDPLVVFTSTILFVAGIAIMIDFYRQWSDAKAHNGARGGAITYLVIGITLLVFGGANFTEIYDVFDLAGQDTALNIILTILLGATSVTLYVHVHPEIRRRKTLAHTVRTST